MAEPARQMEDNFSPRSGAFSSASTQLGASGPKTPPVINSIGGNNPARDPIAGMGKGGPTTVSSAGKDDRQKTWADDHLPPQPINARDGGRPAAANDNERRAANDNAVDGQRPEQRNIRNVEVTTGKGLQTAGTTAQATGAGVQATGMAAQATGKTMQVGGKALKATGKGVDAGGTALMRAGVAMSATGLGAIVGVPTAILGAGVKVTGVAAEVSGAALDATGKAVDRTGKAINKGGKAVRQAGGKVKAVGKGMEKNPSRNLLLRRERGGKIGPLSTDKVVKASKFIPGPTGKVVKNGAKALELMWERKKVTRANIMVFSYGFGVWWIQFALAMVSLGALGAGAAIIKVQDMIQSTSKALVGDTVTYYLGKMYEYTIGASLDAFSWLFEKFFGFAPFAAFSPSSWFIVLHDLVVIIGWSTLLFAVIVYLFHMIDPFSGKGYKWKMGGFIIAAFMYLIPGLNIIPWFALYTACVWKNPE